MFRDRHEKIYPTRFHHEMIEWDKIKMEVISAANPSCCKFSLFPFNEYK